MSQTRIFVSSTCFDLAHIRQTLSERIVGMGHLPVMSELATFRVDPQATTLENCRSNVENNADLFVLIIGRRRGSLDQSVGKSIVNMEYEAASLAGLDIIVFVDDAVLNLLPIWEEDHDAKLGPIVDSNDILSFVSKIRSEQRWTYAYRSESEIYDVLRKQISGQFRDLLELRRKGSLSALERFRSEPREVLSVLRAKLGFWQVELTAVLLEHRLLKAKEEFQHVLAGRVLGTHRILAGDEYLLWIREKMFEMSGVVKRGEFLLCESLNKACASEEPEDVLSAVNEIGLIFSSSNGIESDVFRTHGPDASEPLREACLGMTSEILEAFDGTVVELRKAVSTARAHRPEDGPLTLNVNTKFTFSREERFSVALAQYRQNTLNDF